MVVSRQPISIVNLKSNTMKNTMQIYTFLRYPASKTTLIPDNLVFINMISDFYTLIEHNFT